jgi:hypothetical protein
MFTETMLRKNPALVKAFTGIPADQFWAWLDQMETELPKYEEQRRDRSDRQRAVGAGRDFDQPLALRVIGVLTYLRLHVPQTVVAILLGLTQSDISRDLRRLLPLIRTVLPCPEVWQVVEDDQSVSDLAGHPGATDRWAGISGCHRAAGRTSQ